MSQNSSVSSILKAARGLIAQGWCQGCFYDNESVCAVGALMQAEPLDNSLRCQAIDPLVDAIGPLEFKKYDNCIPKWNDAPCRTQQEVLAAFDRAIAIAEIEEELSTLKEEEHEPELTAV